MAQETNRGALAGVRILDLTSVIFGPYGTQILADMGADVIKVEGPEADIMRFIEPARSPGMGAIYLNVNRNKRSLALDLKVPAARAALLAVAAGCDVFVHSMRPKAIARLGLDYQALKAARADIIHASAWGFRSDGPYGNRPAYDDVIQAMAGIADLTRRQSGEAPLLAPTIIADKTSGLMLASALLAALFHRERTGEGQALEVPMFETVTSMVMVEHLAGATFDPPAGPPGYARVLSPFRRPQRTKDGYVMVLPYTDRHWRSFFALAGRADLAADARFATARARSLNVGALYQATETIIPQRTTGEWLAALGAAEIPATAVLSLEDLIADPHLAATGFWHLYQHPSEGPLRTPRFPVAFSHTPAATVRRHPPRLGEHTREVLREAGLAGDHVDRLIASRAAQADEAQDDTPKDGRTQP